MSDFIWVVYSSKYLNIEYAYYRVVPGLAEVSKLMHIRTFWNILISYMSLKRSDMPFLKTLNLDYFTCMRASKVTSRFPPLHHFFGFKKGSQVPDFPGTDQHEKHGLQCRHWVMCGEAGTRRSSSQGSGKEPARLIKPWLWCCCVQPRS